ncbi:ribosomal large subunit pseudouridine synthase D [Stella humosa]|uniref:Pseudouridine synthase n=2 Tax=Stella humosa TaxID=94 RepID=A0A3N1M9P7_9PROT|nr:ribosomal large subunit pseudouridine synthase D [Stella humosa]BBK31009.1 pseudouridine synthase [Stella humosa]
MADEDESEGMRIFMAAAEDAGERADRFLAARFDGTSRSRIKSLIEGGAVSVDGATLSDPAFRVKAGQTFAILVPEPVAAQPEAQDIALSVVYEDEEVIVVDKPAGMVVHPAPGNPDGTLVNALLAHCGPSLKGIGGERRPGIVHRIDKDTSGLLVAAKSEAALAGLQRQFADHSAARAYFAVVWGQPSPAADSIEGPIGRHPVDRQRMAIVQRGGRAALTRYRTIRRVGSRATLLECRLATGRTHQIRVHLSSRGHPLVGDQVYGRTRSGRQATNDRVAQAALDGFARQALHAALLGFSHPITGMWLEFESALPQDIGTLLARLELI